MLVFGAGCIFVWFSFRKSFPVRVPARAGDRYPLAGQSSAAGGSPEVGALPNPGQCCPGSRACASPQALMLRGWAGEQTRRLQKLLQGINRLLKARGENSYLCVVLGFGGPKLCSRAMAVLCVRGMLEMLGGRWLLQALDTTAWCSKWPLWVERSMSRGNCRSLARDMCVSPVLITSWAGYHPPTSCILVLIAHRQQAHPRKKG